jgi:hypothetical protein
MADITTNYSFPFPEPSDVVDVTGDIQALAESIDSSMNEIVQDVVGTMVTGNTETGIAVTYSDSTGKLNFNVTADPFPSQTGNTGKYLTTNGTATSWAALSAIGVSYLDLTNVPATFAPTAHKTSHEFGGTDAITIAQSQVTDLTTALSGKAASSHTHPQSDINNLTTDLAAKAPLASPTFTGTITGKPAIPATDPDSATSIGYVGLPQVVYSSGTIFQITKEHAGKHIYVTGSNLTVTIIQNAVVPLEIGTTVVIVNKNFPCNIDSPSDVLRLAGTSSTGIRTLAAYGVATLIKVDVNTWVISGNGLS